MKRLRLGKYVYQVTIYDPVVALEKIRQSGIKIYSFKRTAEYTYRFKSSYLNHKKIMETVKGVKFIKREGIVGIIRNMFTYKTTLAALVIGCICLNYVSSLVLKVTINGDNNLLIPPIRLALNKYGIRPYSFLMSDDKLLEIETSVAKEMKDKLEWLQIRKKGSLINVRFLKRRVSPIMPKNGEEVYAQKDGLIAYLRVSSGQVLIKVNQFVRKGDLLISPYIESTSGDNIWVGTRGSVYAYTWHLISAEVDYASIIGLGEDERYLLLLDRVHEKLSYVINGNDELIKNEKILQFNQNKSKLIMKVHYTLIEDITR